MRQIFHHDLDVHPRFEIAQFGKFECVACKAYVIPIVLLHHERELLQIRASIWNVPAPERKFPKLSLWKGVYLVVEHTIRDTDEPFARELHHLP